MLCLSCSESKLPDIHVVQVCSHIELFTVERSTHGLPASGDWCDQLPMFLVSHPNWHGKCRFVGLPAIRDGVSLPIKAQLQCWNGSITEILVEDGGQIAPTVLAEVGCDVRRHDGLVFEVLIVVMQQGKPFMVIIDNA